MATPPAAPGLDPHIQNALVAIMRCVVPSMFKAQEPWALMGSTASVLQGLRDYTPPDIDLATTRDGAYIMEGCVGNSGATVRPVAYSSSDRYTSYFGIFEVMDVKVEVMGDLIIHCEDGRIDVRDHWSRWSEEVRVREVEGLHIPLIAVEWQIVANALLGRPERVAGCAACMREQGYDRAFLETLLTDQQLGERTISWVRRELGIGG
ncbi:MAG: hypothetical protein WEC75_08425 [Dehalococcoidia bacterium]